MDHGNTANLARNIGTMLWMQGRYFEALAWIDRALAAVKKLDQTAQFHMIGRRAQILLRLGRGAEGLRSIEEAAVELARRTGEYAERSTVDLATFHAQLLIELGRPAEAVPLARLAADAQRGSAPYDHPRRASAECMLGWALLAAGHEAEGRAHLALGLPGFRAYGITDQVARAAIDKLLAAPR